MPKEKPKKQPKEAKVGDFTVILNLRGEEITASGATIEECLANLKPKFVKSTGIFSLKYGDKTVTMKKFFRPHIIKRLAVNEGLRGIVAKQLRMYAV